MSAEYHTPVLTDTVLHYLQASRKGIYVDGTLGGGGHAESIFRVSSPESRLVGFDVDTQAISFAEQRLKIFDDRITYVQDNFSNLKKRLHEHAIYAVDGILFDLGVSSHQLDEAARGFSFQRDGRIDMRMNQEQRLDGWTVVNTYDKEHLSEVFRNYGEERHARRIAGKIVDARKQQPVASTEQLSRIIESAIGKRFLQKSMARLFQAIRIEVNNELEHLRHGLRDAVGCLRPGGRIVVISYHSLEDRIVKDFFVQESSKIIRSGNKYVPDRVRQPGLALLTKKPITATDEEIATNPRARSAKLRAAEKMEL